jgi:hypothetical protein
MKYLVLLKYSGNCVYHLKNAVFWDVAPCTSCVNRHSRGTYRLHLHGRKIASEEPAWAGGCRLSHQYKARSYIRTVREEGRATWEINREEMGKQVADSGPEPVYTTCFSVTELCILLTEYIVTECLKAGLVDSIRKRHFLGNGQNLFSYSRSNVDTRFLHNGGVVCVTTDRPNCSTRCSLFSSRNIVLRGWLTELTESERQ